MSRREAHASTLAAMNRQKLVTCFSRALGIAPTEVVDGLTYNGIRKWDSLGHMALVAELESTFNIMLDTNDILAMSSVAKAREILSRYGVAFDAP